MTNTQHYSYTCIEEDGSKRLDYILKNLFPLLGLRARRRLCEEKLVFVNGKVADASQKMRSNNIVTVNIVTVDIPHHTQDNLLGDNLLENNLPENNLLGDYPLCRFAWTMKPHDFDVKNYILQETAEFAAIFKPPFIHSAHIKYKNIGIISKSIQNVYDMESLLPLIFPKREAILLNRLDFATSGILMIAFSKDAEKKWKILQKTGKSKKFYLALVEGALLTRENEDEIIPIQGKIFSKKTQKVYVDSTIQGDRLTHVLPLCIVETENYGTCSLVLCEITKGARHQIRAHLSSIGHPLVGDTKYHAKRTVSYAELMGIISQKSSSFLDLCPSYVGMDVFFLHHLQINFLDFVAEASLKELPLPFLFTSSFQQKVQKQITNYFQQTIFHAKGL